MKKNSFFKSLPFKLLVGVVLGLVIGLILNSAETSGFITGVLNVVVTLKYILGQVINFCVPLIIIGFIAPSITKLGNSASRMLGVAIVIAYASSVGAALFSMAAGYALIPHLSIVTDVEGLKALPDIVFELAIPQIMSVMSALVFSVMVGLAATWNKAKLITGILDEFQKIVLSLVSKVIIPILYCADLLFPRLRRLHYQAASCFLTGNRNCTPWSLYLDGASVRTCRRLFKRKSNGSGKKLRSCLLNCSGNHVLCCYTGCCTAVCK